MVAQNHPLAAGCILQRYCLDFFFLFDFGFILLLIFLNLLHLCQVPSTSFVVDRESGHVWLRGNPLVVTSRDRRSLGDDVIRRLGITVLAVDDGGWSAQTRVEVTVRPLGSTLKKTLLHQPPSFTEKIFVFEVRASAPVGHVVGRLVIVVVTCSNLRNIISLFLFALSFRSTDASSLTVQRHTTF